jgi:molecular chaperone GrpE
MDDTPRNAQDTANEAEEIKQPDATAPSAEPGNGSKPQETPAATTAAGEEDTKTGEAGAVSLEALLADAQAQASEYLDGWQRSRAEFANYKKRAEKEREEIYQNAALETLRKLLPIIDDFDRAVASVPADKANDELIRGFSLIHHKLLTLLDNAGVKVINPVGEAFDPAFHEAIGRDESSDVTSGHITVVLQKGYVYGDKVLRPALVRVAA